MSRPAKLRLRDPEPALRELKIQLCHEIKKARWRNCWNQRQAEIYMGTSRARLSEVDNLRVEKLSVSQLFRYLASANPNFRVLIAQ